MRHVLPVTQRSDSTIWTDPDDAPELTAGVLAEAEVFKGEQFVRAGRVDPRPR